MAELISVPLKKPTDVDIIKPLKNLIDSNYSTADKPEDYTEQINELSKLRNAAVWRAFEKYESSLEVIYSYYDQLCALELKIPPSEVQIPFKWKDAFSVRNSLFGGRISLTITSLAYERVCVLFNIGALQSAVASSQTIDNDEGLKLAAKLFQQSAGVFNHLKGTVMAAIQQDPTPDLNPDTLAALSSLMLAQAQETFVHKAIHDNMKDAVTAKLASQCEELYAEAMKLMQKDAVRPIWDKDWILVVAGKQAIFHGMAQFYQSLVCKANKAVGEEIARLQGAIELFKAGQQRSGKPSMASDLINKAQRHLAEAQKDNDFIYHERIPDPKSLATVPKVALAKSLAPPHRFSANFRDLFDKLVPMPVHQAMAAYEVRKSELVNTEVSKLREATQLLNSCLASLNLPAALEDTSGQELPQSLKDKAETVRNLGGVAQLDAMIRDLPELLQRNRDILDEADRMLNDEYQSDEQLRQQFKERWTRTPSIKLTETFRANTAKYREIINNATNADATVKEKFNQHRRGMELLSEGPTVMAASVPSAGPNSSSGGAHNSSAAGKLRALMDKVETLKAERDAIECELKCASSDMKEQFLAALSDGSINEQALSVETLGRAYGPLQKQVKESLERQEALLNEIQTTNTEFCREKSGAGGMAQKREEALKELAAAHDAYIELQNNLKEGNKFYNDLTQLLVVFQNKISDYCFARKTEKEELLKDLTRDLSHGPVGVLPTAPTHHGNASAAATDSSVWPTLSKFTSYLNFGSGGSAADTKKQPPPRPPPPAAAPAVPTAANLPYPMNPQGMPIPYGAPAAAAAPYPTYALPPGYNPYHTLPAYPQQAYQQYPQYPPQYGNYAHYPPGQQPPQQNHPSW